MKLTLLTIALTAYALTAHASYLPEPQGFFRQNVFLNVTEHILIITWTESDASDIVSYNIYCDSTVIGAVSADDPLCFRACLPACDCCKTFSIAAVNSFGVESNHIPVKVR